MVGRERKPMQKERGNGRRKSNIEGEGGIGERKTMEKERGVGGGKAILKKV